MISFKHKHILLIFNRELRIIKCINNLIRIHCINSLLKYLIEIIQIPINSLFIRDIIYIVIRFIVNRLKENFIQVLVLFVFNPALMFYKEQNESCKSLFIHFIIQHITVGSSDHIVNHHRTYLIVDLLNLNWLFQPCIKHFLYVTDLLYIISFVN